MYYNSFFNFWDDDPDEQVPAKLVVREGTERIADYKYSSNSTLEEVFLPSTLKTIGEGAFTGCPNLKRVVFGNRLTAIGDYAFENCFSLEEVELPPSLRRLGDQIFADCHNLKRVVLPPDLRAIPNFTFYECYALESIRIPDTVTSIGKSAFRSCVALKSVDLPEALTTLEEFAFEYCAGLETLRISACLKSLPPSALNYCTGLKEIIIHPDSPCGVVRDNVVITRDGKNLITIPGGFTGAFRVPDGLTGIRPRALRGCEKITSIYVPDSVTSIGYMAFSDCSGLKELRLPQGLRVISEELCEDCHQLRTVVMPQKVERIWKNAFARASLTSIVLPQTLNTIDPGCFQDVSPEVVNIECPVARVNFRSMGIRTEGLAVTADLTPFSSLSPAFQNYALKGFARRYNDPHESGSIPDTVRTECLDYIQKHRLKLWKDPDFRHIILNENYILAREYQTYWNLAAENGGPELQAELLEYRKNRLDGEELRKIEEKRREKELRSLNRTEPTVAELRKVWRCSKWSEESQILDSWRGSELDVAIPSHVGRLPIRFIGPNAFDATAAKETEEVRQHRLEIRKITVPEGVRWLRHMAFYGCRDLKEIVLPESLIHIDQKVFSYCASLQEIVIPKGVVQVELNAFWECRNLKKVTFLGNDTWVTSSGKVSLHTFQVAAPQGSWMANWVKKTHLKYVPLPE